MPTNVPDDATDRTQTQVEPPAPRTAELGGETTNPTFGSLSATPAAGFPFLSAPQAADELGRLGEYRVLALLGEGGMGFVFRGEDTALRRPVALKVMRPEVAAKPNAADRFLREGRAAAALKSDHVITIYQVGRANGVPFLAMEFLEGLPVDAWLKRQAKPVPLALAVRIARDCLRGLAAAHEKGLVHRDIKPANLWIEKGTGRVKVLDFGLTRGADGGDQMTVEGAVVGTPAFMAPEQAGGKPVDGRADLFSVGTVLHTLLTGRNPFQRDTLMGTLGAVAFEDPPPVTEARPDVPAAHAAFVARLLSKKLEDRPADARAALKELAEADRQAAQTQATAAPPVAPVPVPAAPAALRERGAGANPAADAPTQLDEPAPGGPRLPAPGRRLLAGGLFGFLALAAAGVVIVITNKDGTRTRIEVPDGAAVEVQKGGQTVAAVGPTPGAAGAGVPAGAADPDRRAAEFVLRNGGDVNILGSPEWISGDPRRLPAGPFKCGMLGLARGRPVTAAELDLLLAPDALTTLTVHHPPTDAAIDRVARSPSAGTLTQLYLLGPDERTDDAIRALPARLPALRWLCTSSKRFTGSGLADLKTTRIDSLDLAGSGVRDEHLAHLAGWPAVVHLNVNRTPVTDAGLPHIGRLAALEHLHVQDLDLTDRGFSHLGRLPNLRHLYYCNSPDKGRLTGGTFATLAAMRRLEEVRVQLVPVTAADVRQLTGLENLARVGIHSAPGLTDAALTAFAGVKPLKQLVLSDCKGLTAAGAKAFRAARPDVELVCDADKD